jgi:hypothetical protein
VAGLVAAKVVDHVTPLKDGGERFDASNLQGLCVSCHNAKTARETAWTRADDRQPVKISTDGILPDAFACLDLLRVQNEKLFSVAISALKAPV